MHHALSEHAVSVLAQARAAADVLRAGAAGADAGGLFPRDSWNALGPGGLLGIPAESAAYGPTGPWRVLVDAVEILSGACAATGTVAALHVAGAVAPLARYGAESMDAVRDALMEGDTIAAVLLPEAPDGSGELRWPAVARAEAGGFVLEGEGSWVPGAMEAGILVVHALLNDEPASFLVDASAEGVARRAVLGMGLRGAAAGRVRLNGVRVEESALLGGVERSREAADRAHGGARIILAAAALGVGAAALEEATAFAAEPQGERAPASWQSVQWHLADAVTELEVTRLLVRQAAHRRDTEQSGTLEGVSMAKLAADANTVSAADRSLQILGARGYVSGSPVERAYRDARSLSLFGGSPQYERRRIVEILLDEERPSDLPGVPLTEEQRLLRDTIREFTRAEAAPLAAEHERNGTFPRELVMRLWNELGIGAMLAGETYGGMELDPVAYNIVVEELAREWPSLSIIVAVHNSVNVQLIDLHGTDDQKAAYLPRLATEWVGAFSLSEPSAGSDVAAMRATAVRDGDEYVLNGEKNWVTNGKAADIYVLFAKTDPQAGSRGITAFLVERGAPGLTVTQPERKMGIKASEAVSLIMEDCRVPVGNRLGEEGEGFRIAMMELDGGRIGVASQALGIAGGAMDRSIRYARERVAFGRPIAEFQAIQEMLAEMALRIRASRLLAHQAATLRGEDRPHSREASMAKLFATEGASWVAHRAIQIHGGYGYTEDYEVERFYRDARVTEIYEGTSEVQRIVIARNWLKEHGHRVR